MGKRCVTSICPTALVSADHALRCSAAHMATFCRIGASYQRGILLTCHWHQQVLCYIRFCSFIHSLHSFLRERRCSSSYALFRCASLSPHLCAEISIGGFLCRLYDFPLLQYCDVWARCLGIPWAC